MSNRKKACEIDVPRIRNNPSLFRQETSIEVSAPFSMIGPGPNPGQETIWKDSLLGIYFLWSPPSMCVGHPTGERSRDTRFEVCPQRLRSFCSTLRLCVLG